MYGPGRVAERGQTNGTSSVKEGGNPKSTRLRRVWYLICFCAIHHQYYWSIFSPAGPLSAFAALFCRPQPGPAGDCTQTEAFEQMLWLSYFRVTTSVPAARQKALYFVTNWESKGYSMIMMRTEHRIQFVAQTFLRNRSREVTTSTVSLRNEID